MDKRKELLDNLIANYNFYDYDYDSYNKDTSDHYNHIRELKNVSRWKRVEFLMNQMNWFLKKTKTSSYSASSSLILSLDKPEKYHHR